MAIGDITGFPLMKTSGGPPQFAAAEVALERCTLRNCRPDVEMVKR
jgi:hypothetical protein